MIGQIPKLWFDILDHSVALAVVLFFGVALWWGARRLFGDNGLITESMKVSSEAVKTNTETLTQLKEHHVSQFQLCSRHAQAMEDVSGGQQMLDAKITATLVATQGLAAAWASEHSDQFKVAPVLDAMLLAVDTASMMAERFERSDFISDLTDLRRDIKLIRSRVDVGADE